MPKKNVYKSHSDQKGFLQMDKKWGNLGVPKNKLAEGAKKFKIDDKRTKIKA